MSKKSKDKLPQSVKPDPTTANYAKYNNNRSHINTPFGQDEPSRETTYK